MKAFFVGISLVLGLSISSGCQNQSQANESDTKLNNQDTTSEVLAPEVQIMAEKQVEKGQKETISAIVTLGEEFVDDADVVFEIKHDEDSKKITANFVENGEYVIDYTFESDGQYEIIAHTNAKDYHIMPSMQLQVGDPVESPQVDEKSETTEHHHDHENKASEE
ncbi:hypothetical protein CJ195_12915 [Bacillus sp. UMB0899]|nr:hypothetical protein CJ195_12915 [Bacillus sp. UMB0899]